MGKELHNLIKDLEDQNFEVERSSRGRYKVRRDGRLVAVLAGNPADHRAMANAISILKQAGYRPR